jgi:hypothetical protein
MYAHICKWGLISYEIFYFFPLMCGTYRNILKGTTQSGTTQSKMHHACSYMLNGSYLFWNFFCHMLSFIVLDKIFIQEPNTLK